MRKLGANSISNLATKLWSMVSIYLFIPLYIKYLGEAAYGLVSFFATLQTTLNILGLGLANTLRREFATGEGDEENSLRKYKLLRDIELIYFAIGAFISVLCIAGSNAIADHWLNIENLDPQMVATVIGMMGISIALQMIANLYAGCLFGLDYQVLANILCIIWSASKSIGALFIIAVVSPNLVYFYAWHIFNDLVYVLILRTLSVMRLNLSNRIWSFQDFKYLKNIWQYTLGVLFISFIALVNKQLDKIVISKFLTLTELGAYNVATTLGSLTTIVPTAMYTTVFPRFTKLATTGKEDELQREFISINRLVNVILSCMAGFVAVYASPLINVWTGSNNYVQILGFVSTLVVLSVAITEYQEVPYALALAHGNTKYNVTMGLAFIPIIFVSTYFAIQKYGLVGAGIVYLATSLSQTLIYEFMVYRKYLGTSIIKTIVQYTVFPLVMCFTLAELSKIFVCKFTSSSIKQSLIAAFLGAVTLIILLLALCSVDIKKFMSEREKERK